MAMMMILLPVPFRPLHPIPFHPFPQLDAAMARVALLEKVIKDAGLRVP